MEITALESRIRYEKAYLEFQAIFEIPIELCRLQQHLSIRV